MITGFVHGLFWLTMNVYFEARGEPYEGMKMVAHSVLNRVQQRHMGVVDVVRQSKQYSWYNGLVIPAIKNPGALLECMAAAFEAWTVDRPIGKLFDGVTHYHADSVAPYWTSDRKMIYLGKVGKHLYYREERKYY